MTNLLILTTAKKAYAPRRLVEEASALNINPHLVSYYSLSWDIQKDKQEWFSKGESLPNMDYVILREPGYNGIFTPQRDYLLKYYDANGARILNKDSFTRWSNLDKFTQMIELQKHNLPFVKSKNYCSRKQILNAIVNFPLIAKSHSGSHGDHVYKVNSEEELVELLQNKKLKPSELLFQPMLPNAEDIRVIVIGGKVIGAMKRIAKVGSHLSNFSAGGTVEKYDLINDSEAVKITESVVDVFECEYAGVDLMKDENGNWRVLEINRSCQFEGFEQATGINVAKITLEYLLSKK